MKKRLSAFLVLLLLLASCQTVGQARYTASADIYVYDETGQVIRNPITLTLYNQQNINVGTYTGRGRVRVPSLTPQRHKVAALIDGVSVRKIMRRPGTPHHPYIDIRQGRNRINLFVKTGAAQLPIPQPVQQPRQPIQQPQQPTPFCYDDHSDKIHSPTIWDLDFEHTQENGLPHGWLPFLPRDDADTPSTDIDNTAHSGRSALKYSSSTKNTHGGLSYHQPHPLPPGEYVLLYWAKADNLAGSVHFNRITHRTLKRDDEYKTSFKGSVIAHSYPPSGTYDWQKIERRFTVPSGQEGARISSGFAWSTGTLWLDDIILLPAPTYDSLDFPLVQIETRNAQKQGSPSRHYFTRDEPIRAEVILTDLKDTPGSYIITAELTFCGQTMKSTTKQVTLQADKRLRVPVLDINPRTLALGDYLLEVTIEGNGKRKVFTSPVGLRLDPSDPDFLLSIGTHVDLAREEYQQRIDRLSEHFLTPLFYGNEPLAHGADVTLASNVPFTIRSMYPGDFPQKVNEKGEAYGKSLSDPSAWTRAGQYFADRISIANAFPSYSSPFVTSDDMKSHMGLDWNENNKRRYKQQYDTDPPTATTAEIEQRTIKKPPGLIDPQNDPWYTWVKFLIEANHGGYNKEITKQVRKVKPDLTLMEVPGGMQVPLMTMLNGLYPPFAFGKDRFNPSYYMYLSLYRPSTAYDYYNQLAASTNRDLDLYMMPSTYTINDRAYFWNVFFLNLFSGVDALLYFYDDLAALPTQPEFNVAMKQVIGPIATTYGPMITRLENAGNICHLVPLSASAYEGDFPKLQEYIYANLLLAHLDLKVVTEEEILHGISCDAVVMQNVKHLREDVAATLKHNYLTVIDDTTTVPLSGPRVHKLATPIQAFYKEYATPRLTELRDEFATLVSPHVTLDAGSQAVGYHTYEGGPDAHLYLSLIDVHTSEEVDQKKKLHTNPTDVTVRVRAPSDFVVADVFSGTIIPSTYNRGWIAFDATIPRLQGKLFTILKKEPTSIVITTTSLKPDQSFTLRATVTNNGKPIRAHFPLHIELIDPNGKQHAYTQYSSTNENGIFELPLTLGINAPKGKWTIRITDLSTGLEQTKTVTLT